MIIEYADFSINAILLARIVAFVVFAIVVWRVHYLYRKIQHIETLTKTNFDKLQANLADAIAMAERSIEREKQEQAEDEQQENAHDGV